MMSLERMSWGSAELKSVKKASPPVLQEALAVIEWNLYKKATLPTCLPEALLFRLLYVLFLSEKLKYQNYY